MSEKKRKRHDHGDADRPRKKNTTERSTAQNIWVSLAAQDSQCAPVLASTPGLSFPIQCPLKPYHRSRSRHPTASKHTNFLDSEYLLHSSSHPKLDHLARENESLSTNLPLLNHYIAIYSPSTSELQLVPTRKLTLRSHLRSSNAPPPNPKDPETTTTLSARSNLALTFGTKKAQKSIRALTENAISPTKNPPLTPSSSATGPPPPTLDPLASAVLDSMTGITSAMASREDLQALASDSHPRPKPHLDAQRPEDIYPIEELVGETMLRAMQVREWEHKITNNEEVFTKSRFVSGRIRAVAESGDVKALK
ncbi:MAG: hypothetical protein Q9190_006289, partial [Brigantiaea leucoxantha]